MESITLKCSNGFTLVAEGDSLIIKMKKTDEAIPVSRIQSFSLRKPGMMYGKIIFKTAAPSTAGLSIVPGLSAAIGSERTYFYKKEDYDTAVQIYDYVTSYGAKTQETPASNSDTANEIRALKSLLDDGILTQEEFDAKKKQLLGI